MSEALNDDVGLRKDEVAVPDDDCIVQRNDVGVDQARQGSSRPRLRSSGQ
ncbi:MAG: hypothetical protein JNK99_06240 [Candidatus Accumulibacter sp.]|nr:hypothetical protein [Accumulibacter sp.]MBL8394342.1 hypothetical protein [Accumulibacter sp.]